MPRPRYSVLRPLAGREDRGHVAAYGVFRGTHTGDGGPVPPTGKQVEADYVYVMEFDGDRIRHLTKIWNDGFSLAQIGSASSLDPTAALLAEIIRVDTSNPPGHEGAIAEMLAPRFRAAGFDVDIVPTPEYGRQDVDLTSDDPEVIRRADREISKGPLLHAIIRNTIAPESPVATDLYRALEASPPTGSIPTRSMRRTSRTCTATTSASASSRFDRGPR